MNALLSIILALASIGLVFALIQRFIANPNDTRQASKLVYFFGLVSCVAICLPTLLPLGGAA